MMHFHLGDYLNSLNKDNDEQINNVTVSDVDDRFNQICEELWVHIKQMQEDDSERWVELQKKAILGHKKEVQYYLSVINNYITDNRKFNVPYPAWYDSLDEAIFHENWGLAGVFEWFKHKKSSSCKIIGSRIYFLINGKSVLQPQTLSMNRLIRLRDHLLLNDTKQRKTDPYQEIYMPDGTRIQIFNNTKEITIIFRRYLVDMFTFENIASLGTIDEKMIPLFKSMVSCGFNVNMVGQVRSGKTTFLQTYESYEDPTLEGVSIETDFETPWHLLKPNSPIIQIVADDEDLDIVGKPIMRSDGDYLLMMEARDGRALRMMLFITKKGTRRVKGTFHTGYPEDFCHDVAEAIVSIYGGEIWSYMIQVAKGFQYLFEFVQLPHDKSKKRLKGLYEIRLDPNNLNITTHKIIEYDSSTDSWTYNYTFGDAVERIGNEENPHAFNEFKNTLKELADEHPMQSNGVVVSPYSQLIPVARGN